MGFSGWNIQVEVLELIPDSGINSIGLTPGFALFNSLDISPSLRVALTFNSAISACISADNWADLA